jgi:hypothetical protein
MSPAACVRNQGAELSAKLEKLIGWRRANGSNSQTNDPPSTYKGKEKGLVSGKIWQSEFAFAAAEVRADFGANPACGIHPNGPQNLIYSGYPN